MIENSKDLNEYNFSCLGIENRNLEALLYGNISHLMINKLVIKGVFSTQSIYFSLLLFVLLECKNDWDSKLKIYIKTVWGIL